jgi:DNA-binding NtrC family response regulator
MIATRIEVEALCPPTPCSISQEFRLQRKLNVSVPKVLLADDEIAFTRNIAKLLTRRGCEVSVANDGESALRVIEDSNFDVLILDMKMPGMGGLEVLKQIEKRHPSLQVIILTGHATMESAIDGLRHGAFDYTTKPIDIEDLTKRVFQAFERKKARERDGSVPF